jgi:hypothetical protein
MLKATFKFEVLVLKIDILILTAFCEPGNELSLATAISAHTVVHVPLSDVMVH